MCIRDSNTTVFNCWQSYWPLNIQNTIHVIELISVNSEIVKEFPTHKNLVHVRNIVRAGLRKWVSRQLNNTFFRRTNETNDTRKCKRGRDNELTFSRMMSPLPWQSGHTVCICCIIPGCNCLTITLTPLPWQPLHVCTAPSLPPVSIFVSYTASTMCVTQLVQCV